MRRASDAGGGTRWSCRHQSIPLFLCIACTDTSRRLRMEEEEEGCGGHMDAAKQISRLHWASNASSRPSVKRAIQPCIRPAPVWVCIYPQSIAYRATILADGTLWNGVEKPPEPTPPLPLLVRALSVRFTLYSKIQFFGGQI